MPLPVAGRAGRTARAWLPVSARPSRRISSDCQPTQDGPEPKTSQDAGRAVLPPDPAALLGGLRETSLVRLALPLGGPGLHDLGLDSRVHRALPQISIGTAVSTERASAVLIHQ